MQSPGPLVMGIVNVTPDSFFDGGRYADPDRAVARGMEMIAEGADIVDIGGESSRPGAEPVPEAEELARVVEVVAALAPHVRVSIDTNKSRVAEAAIAAGASIVNDVSASLEAVAGRAGVGWIAMHSRGTPKTMPGLTSYADLVGEVRDHLRRAADRGRRAGVSELWVDPGIGFAKTAEQSWELVGRIAELVGDGTPVLLGASRKSFLAPVGAVPAERAEASLAVAVWSMLQGVSIVRVHDVGSTAAAAGLIRGLRHG